MQQLPQQHSNIYRQLPSNLQSIDLPSRPPASSAAFADNRNSGYARQLGPSASLPSSPFDGPAAQVVFQRSDIRSYAQPISPMSPIENLAGNPASAPRTANCASRNSYSPQLPHPRPNVTLQDLQLQQQQLRTQNQVFNFQPSASTLQGYQNRPSISHARTYPSQNAPAQSQSWPSGTTNVHTQTQATRRHTVDVPLSTNQPIQPRSQPSSLSAPTQQRVQQHASAQAMMGAMAPSASSPTVVSFTATSRVASQPASVAASNNIQSAPLMSSASSPAVAPQHQANARPPPMSALVPGPQQQQQQQPGPVPSDQSLAHARSVLSPLGRYLERAYISSQLAVAQEFDSLSGRFHGLRREKEGLEQIIKDRDAEISRLRRKVLDWETKHKSLADECAMLKNNAQQWLASYGHQETLRKAKADLEAAQKVNKALTQTIFQRGQMNTDSNIGLDPNVPTNIDPADVKLVSLGVYTVPQALADALQSTITKTMTDQFEKQLAEMMLTNVAEKSKIENENALLKAHLIAQGIDLPSSVQQNAEPAMPRLKPEIRTTAVEPFVSPLTPPAEPAVPPRTLTAVALPPKTPIDISNTVGNPSEQHRHEAGNALLPTPTSTASPQNEIMHIVKQEAVDSFPFPWRQGEIVDLTELVDSPAVISEALAPLGLSLQTLEKHMEDSIDQAPQAAEQAQTVDSSFAARLVTEEPTVSTSTTIPINTPGDTGKKRDSMDANIEDDVPEARKKQRLETSEDVEMAEEQSGSAGVPEIGRDSTPPDFLADAMRIETSTPQPTSLANESPPDTSTQAAPQVEATAVGLPSSFEQATDQPPVANGSVPAAQETSIPDSTSSESLSSMSISPPSSRPSTSLPDEQSPVATLPVSEPSSAMATKFSSLDTAPPQLGNSTVIEVRVKQELNETALATLPPPRPSSSQPRATDVKFSLRHFELAYNTNGDRRTCRMCMMRKKADATYKVAAFPVSASWDELRDHCADVHPEGFRTLIGLSPSKIAEMNERMKKQTGSA